MHDAVWMNKNFFSFFDDKLQHGLDSTHHTNPNGWKSADREQASTVPPLSTNSDAEQNLDVGFGQHDNGSNGTTTTQSGITSLPVFAIKR
jgi:hypothetical protein